MLLTLDWLRETYCEKTSSPSTASSPQSFKPVKVPVRHYSRPGPELELLTMAFSPRIRGQCLWQGGAGEVVVLGYVPETDTVRKKKSWFLCRRLPQTWLPASLLQRPVSILDSVFLLSH